jgi:hypothetical protein
MMLRIVKLIVALPKERLAEHDKAAFCSAAPRKVVAGHEVRVKLEILGCVRAKAFGKRVRKLKDVRAFVRRDSRDG